jgi:hypothetical protein
MSLEAPTYTTEEAEETPVDGLARGVGDEVAAIDRLKPNSPLHLSVKEKLLDMIRMSENQMNSFYDRWRANELQYQAYLKTETMDQLKKGVAKTGTPPELVTITVPYTYATVQTVVSYLTHAFCGRFPMFQVATVDAAASGKAQNLEYLLQYNGDRERIITKLVQFFLDGEMYGLQAMRMLWKVEKRQQTTWMDANPAPGLFMQTAQQPVRKEVVVFEGNELRNLDPFKFFPDPRVPMSEVAEKGEFVFWREFEGRFRLRKAEAAGFVKWVGAIPKGVARPAGDSESQRGRLAGQRTAGWKVGDFGLEDVQIDQGTVELIPSEWGLGAGTEYEKWLFSIANKEQIIQAEPLGLDHGKHPVIVGEPHTTGYEFGQMAMTDMIGPMQEFLSWMFNSHIFNVRAALNNTFLVNPQMVDMQDMKKPGPGRVIKMKPAAFGQDIKNAFYQVPVTDVTSGHIQDMQIVQRMADNVSATNDSLRGVTTAGGRKSATEIRQSGEAGASRLAYRARLISAQSIVPLAEMETYNFQQLMSQEVFVKTLGMEALKNPINISPDDIAGSYYFPVHDGMLPLDRVALLEVWKEIFQALIQVPGFAQAFDVMGVFEYMAKLGGATNLSTFRVQTMGNEQIDQALSAGNMVPAGAKP